MSKLVSGPCNVVSSCVSSQLWIICMTHVRSCASVDLNIWQSGLAFTDSSRHHSGVRTWHDYTRCCACAHSSWKSSAPAKKRESNEFARRTVPGTAAISVHPDSSEFQHSKCRCLCSCRQSGQLWAGCASDHRRPLLFKTTQSRT